MPSSSSSGATAPFADPASSALSEAAALPVQQAAVWEPFLPWMVVLLPLLGFVANGLLALVSATRSAAAVRAGGTEDSLSLDGGRPRTHRWPTYIGPGVMIAAFLLAIVNFAGMLGADLHEPVVAGPYWTWLATSSLRIDVALHLDQLSMIMMLVVTGVGSLIHVFSVGYMRDDPGYPRYFAYLNLFVFFMLVLVLGAGYPLMFVGWEGVGLCSYLLIGYWFADREKADAGKKAFIVNRIGDFGFLLAMFLLFDNIGALDFVSVFEGAEAAFSDNRALVTTATLLFMLGAAGKSAQVPLHVWLPDAMAGPTPVSALIHAATMVTAGVYVIARSSALFALAPASQAVVAGIGALTALLAATIALRQYDIKKVLAYSTVSQLGFMFLAAGVGAYTAAVFHLVTHAFFKALLFLGAGAVIHSLHHAFHETGSKADAQDMRNMGGLRAKMPVTWAVMGIATLAIAGVWPLAGFFSKDEIIWYAGAWAGAPGNANGSWYVVFWVVALATALLTAFYMTRLMVMTFHGRSRLGDAEQRHVHDSPWVMRAPLIVLAVLSVAGGLLNVPESLRVLVFGAAPFEWLHHWLEPVTHAAAEIQVAGMGEAAHQSPVGGGELTWALISTVAALAVVGGAFAVLRKRLYRTAAEDADPRTGLALALERKWYFDEAYDRAVVRPVLALSRWCWKIVDGIVIDGFVNLAAALARLAGWTTSLFHTGQVNTYAFVLALGVLAVLGAVYLP